MNSKQKGNRGERELCKALRDYGYNCYRTQQYCGNNGDADVEGLDGIHIECKRTERLQLYDSIAQAVHDTKGGLPTVFHKKNNCGWLVVMRLEDWMKLYKGEL